MREQRAELSHFNFHKIHMLGHLTANIKELRSLGMCTADNLEKIMKGFKLLYSMSNKLDVSRQILKY